MYKILLTALIAGLLSGVFVFGVQSVKLTPLILQAEIYENAEAQRKEAAEATMAASHQHEHEEEAWEPANGFERNAYRLLADLGVGVGYALILVGAFTLQGGQMDTQRGILWGLAGFGVFSLAPGFGLAPELPATMVADLAERQLWWLSAVVATAGALYLIVFKHSNIAKCCGVALMTAPHILGAPKSPVGGVVPPELNAEFAAASLATMALFWVVLGAASGWFYNRQQAAKIPA